MDRKRIIVTGGSGKAGRACVIDLLEHRYDVLVVDRVAPYPKLCRSIVADLSDFGQTIDALCGGGDLGGPCDVHAVVHLAAIPAPRLQPNAATFANNTLGDYHVFEACRRLGIKHVVYASSETVLGLTVRPSRRCTRRWTKRSRRGRRVHTRCPSCWPKRWRSSSAGGTRL